jgi:hypothetical protein
LPGVLSSDLGELSEFHLQVECQLPDEVPLCPAEPDLLVLQHVDDVPEAELTDEREPGNFVKVFAVRDRLPELDRVTVLGDEWMDCCFGRAKDEDEVTGLHVE